MKHEVAEVKGSINELRSLVKDFRMQVVGGMTAAIDLYESCIVSSLLTNSGTWTEIRDAEIELLDEHFLQGSSSAPYVYPQVQPQSLFWSARNEVESDGVRGDVSAGN